MTSVTLNEFMQILRQHKFYKMNQTKFLEYIVLYLNEGRCYRLILHAYPTNLRGARKVGIQSIFTAKPVNLNYTIKTPDQIIPHDIRQGKYVVQYSIKTRDFNVYKERQTWSTHTHTATGGAYAPPTGWKTQKRTEWVLRVHPSQLDSG